MYFLEYPAMVWRSLIMRGFFFFEGFLYTFGLVEIILSFCFALGL